MTHRIAIVGGTGPEGRGLATRFALAGHAVVLGSRDRERAAAAAADVMAVVTGAAPTDQPRGTVSGASNAEAVDAVGLDGLVVLTVPFEAHRATLESLAPALAGMIVVDAVVPVRFERGPRPVEVPEGSAAEQAAALLPGARVVAAFHNIAAEALLDPSRVLHEDVLVASDHAEATAVVSALVAEIASLRAVNAGPLRFARYLEGLTVLLIGINGRYKTRSGVRIEGLPEAGIVGGGGTA